MENGCVGSIRRLKSGFAFAGGVFINWDFTTCKVEAMKRRMLRLLCALTVVTIALGQTARAGALLGLEAGMYDAEPGASVIVEIIVETDQQLTSLNPAISLDPVGGSGAAVMTPGSGTPGSFWGGQATTLSDIFSPDKTAGKYNLSLDNAGESSTGGPDSVVSFEVTVPADADVGDKWDIAFLTGPTGSTWSRLNGAAGETTFSSLTPGMIVVVGEPSPILCDFDNNLACDIADVDLLVNEIVAETDTGRFDLTDDDIVNRDDLIEWLSVAAEKNGFAASFLLGDSNLDGSVNVNDLNALGLSWQQNVAQWSLGDFTASGRVDAIDLNDVGLNWQKSIPLAAAQNVPEPSGVLLLIVAGLIAVSCRQVTAYT